MQNLIIASAGYHTASKKILLIIFCFLFFLSCDFFDQSEKSTIIKGRIENAPGKRIVIEELSPLKVENIASTYTDESGDFIFEFESLAKSFYRLVIDENNKILLYLEPDKNIEIWAKFPEVPRNYQVSGSQDCLLLQEMNAGLIKSTDKLNELRQEFNHAIRDPNIDFDSLRKEFIKVTDNLYENDRRFLTDFIKTNYTSPVIYVALNQYVLTDAVLQIDKDFEVFEFALNSLKEHNPELAQTSLLESEISTYLLRQQQIERSSLNIRPGEKAPEFSLTNIRDDVVNLIDFKGKYLLVHFWASWSSTSREEAKYLKNAHKKFKNEKFEILQISLDRNKDSWENAIEEDETHMWNHASDFAMWDSPMIRMYGITSIPLNILMDTEGKVVAININPRDFVEELSKLMEIK